MIEQSCSDIWIRDWAAVPVAGDSFVKFKYRPWYLLGEEYTLDDEAGVALAGFLNLRHRTSDLIVDGGSIISNGKIALVSQRALSDNSMDRTDFAKRLNRETGLEIMILPPEPCDATGHLDGMINFLGPDTLAVASYEESKGVSDSQTYYERSVMDHTDWMADELQGRLSGIKIIRIPCEFAPERAATSDDDIGSVTGNRINFLISGDFALVPCGLSETDDADAATILRDLGFRVTMVPTKAIASITERGGSLHCMSWNY